jgi:hypothetical protein
MDCIVNCIVCIVLSCPARARRNKMNEAGDDLAVGKEVDPKQIVAFVVGVVTVTDWQQSPISFGM